MVMELIIRKISTKDVLGKMMYVHNSRERGRSQETWNEDEPGEDRSGVGWTGEGGVEHQVGEEGVQARGGVVYLSGMATEYGRSQVEVRRRIQTRANTWRKVGGVILRKCVKPAHLHGLEMVALTEQQQQKLQVCENNLVRIITRATRAEGGWVTRGKRLEGGVSSTQRKK